jgi:hypothetical protein
VGSRYPGKYVCFAMAALAATVAWRSSRIAIRTMREQQKSAAQGIFFKPDAKNSVGANVAVALGATFLLATLSAAIYSAWPN